MGERFGIFGAEVITALGDCEEATWQGLRAGRCGLGPLTQLPGGRYPPVVGAVRAEMIAALRARTGAGEPSLPMLLALAAGRGALAQAATRGRRWPAQRIGLVVSTTKAAVTELEAAVRNSAAQLPDGQWNPATLACDLAAALGLRGPWQAVSTACAGGLLAVAQACRWVRRGWADAVLVIGVDILSDLVRSGFVCLASLSAQPCRPFDAARNGLTLGEGAGAMLVARAGAGARGCVLGWGMGSDAQHITRPAPDGQGLQLAIRRALTHASVETVQLINAHGTATVANDQMEAAALAAVFGQHVPLVNSFKGYIGHTLGAAGVIEAVLCLRSLETNWAPACLGYETVGVEPALPVLRQGRELPQHATVLTVKSGFGGINAAAVLGHVAGDT